MDSRNMDRVTAAYERLDTLLENRRYPVGDRFSRAGLTVARTPLPQQFDPPEGPARSLRAKLRGGWKHFRPECR